MTDKLRLLDMINEIQEKDVAIIKAMFSKYNSVKIKENVINEQKYLLITTKDNRYTPKIIKVK